MVKVEKECAENEGRSWIRIKNQSDATTSLFVAVTGNAMCDVGGARSEAEWTHLLEHKPDSPASPN